jgi:hypothetical protein
VGTGQGCVDKAWGPAKHPSVTKANAGKSTCMGYESHCTPPATGYA